MLYCKTCNRLYFHYRQSLNCTTDVTRECAVKMDGSYVDCDFSKLKVIDIGDVHSIEASCLKGVTHECEDFLSRIDGDARFLKQFLALVNEGENFVELRSLTSAQLLHVHELLKQLN